LRKSLPLLALFCAILQGCAPLPLINGETLYVMVATQRRMDWLKRNETSDRMWAPLLKEYRRLHPNVRVSFYTVREEDLEEELRQRIGRGLGPDLILTRAPMANTLLHAGLIAPVPQTPGMVRSLAEIRPEDLRRVRNGTVLAAVPVSDVVTLACYDRKTLPTPPRTTDELMATAAAGHIIGLSLDGFGIWWTAGTQGAVEDLVPILLGEEASTPGSEAQAQNTIANWLAWLRQLAVLSRVDLASGPEELSQGLQSGRVDWIPCYSLTLSTLREAMGERLGVSALPFGPDGRNPSPFNSLDVWAFGLDSSARQHQRAIDLVKLSVDPFLQRRIVLESQEVLSVNRLVPTPVASSGVLAALAEAQKQSEAGAPSFRKPFDLRHLNVVVPQMEGVIQQVMVGVLTPEEGARQIRSFARSRTP
jgi:arabinogalactan oligomer/maltooligosaccharide transport system substrate-binding protein